MVFLRRSGVAFLLAAGLVMGACEQSAVEDTTTPTVPTPTPVSVTETFSGTLAVEGSGVHNFKAGVGVVTTTLAAVGPDSAIALGFGVGTWDGTSCTLVVQNDSAVQGSYLVGTATTSIDLCVKAYDVGNIVESATYSLSVVHY